VPRITGREGVQVRLSKLIDEDAIRRVGAALFAGGELIRGEASHMITEGATSGKNHIPSLPGEPPNEDTGSLRTHIETTQTGPLQAEVSSNAPYAAVLEFGGSKVLPRPYMQPATNRKRKEVVALVRRAVTEAIKR
jgi:HK97 gp10 family phage protein